MITLWQGGLIELYFGDESGFCLTPTVPYGWAPIGQTASITQKDSKRFNVLGFLSLDLHLRTFYTEGSINSQFVIQAIEQLIPPKEGFRVIVLDNAPMHRAHLFYDQIPRWEKQGLFIFFLPKYSPHLNRIEILWRKIKYEWLKPSDYRSFGALKRKIKSIFSQFALDYQIQFKELNIT